MGHRSGARDTHSRIERSVRQDGDRVASSNADSADLQTRLSQLWCAILGISQVQPHQNFFLLGGDSVQASRLVMRIRATLGIELRLRDVFDAPTLAELVTLVSSRKPLAQPEAARRELAHEAKPTALSFSQERMWFMHALAAASAAYHVTHAIRFRGPVKLNALRAALGELVNRHETLRTTFANEGHHVAPVIHTYLEPEWKEVSLRDVSTDQLDAAREWLCEFANNSFDLERGPLVRAALIHLERDDCILGLVFHHIVVDQWSLDVLTSELAALYTDAVNARRWSLPPPELPYSQYAKWHRDWFTTQRLANDLSYWKSRLTHLDTVALPTDRTRPPQQDFRGAKLRLSLTAAEIRTLTEWSTAQKCSLAMTLVAALAVLMHRYSSATDIGIGLPIANRNHPHTEQLVGTLVNTIVMRADVSGNPSFKTLLQQVRTSMLEGFDHQDMPFELLVRDQQLARDASRTPLFSVLFNMIDTPHFPAHFPELSWSRLDFDRKASQFDLTVTVDTRLDKSICFEYAEALFAPESIENIAQHYLDLLRSLVLEREHHVADLCAARPDEADVVRHWGTGPQHPLAPISVAQLLSNLAHAHSETIAVRFKDVILSYNELHAASHAVAVALQQRGIGRGSRVGLYLERSADLLIAQLGVLKSGAAYVPLDPLYPAERLSYMVQDAELALILHGATGTFDQAHLAVPTWGLEEVLNAADAAGELNPELIAQADDPAYVIYTSGSTGCPKGVVIPHRAVVNFLTAMAVRPGITQQDRVLAVTTLSFDIAVLELLLPLYAGAQIVIAAADQVADGEALRKLIDGFGITVMQATPATWRLLLAAQWHGSAKLKALVGGESLPKDLASQLLARCAELWNMYGPTETTVWSTCGRVADLDAHDITLGTPIDNTTVFVLDAQRRPCPIGVIGEIWISGAGLATGYWNQPQLTAEKFVELDLPGHGLTRLYSTGDRGRWRADGALIHLGRLDHQVKIRGHRIELGDIEWHLSQHPAVAQAVVMTRAADRGDLQLVAYVRPQAHMPDAIELRTHLAQFIPEYMVPNGFVAVERFPTLPNGKLDLRQLASLWIEPTHPEKSTPPATERQQILWNIWRELLDTDAFGIHDDFFALGGHSMLTVRLVQRIRNELRRACTLPTVFRHPTIAQLAVALESASVLDRTELIALQPRGKATTLFCICGIQIYQHLADRLAPDYPVYGIFVPLEMEYVNAGLVHAGGLPSVQYLAAEYLKAIRIQQPKGPYRLLGFSFGGVLAYEIAQQLSRQGEAVEFLGILDSEVPERRARPRKMRLGTKVAGVGRALKRRAKAGWTVAVRDDQAALARRNEIYAEASRNYTAQPYSGTALYFEAGDAAHHDPGYGWDSLIQNLHVYRLPGDHSAILRPPYVDQLATRVRQYLRDLRDSSAV